MFLPSSHTKDNGPTLTSWLLTLTLTDTWARRFIRVRQTGPRCVSHLLHTSRVNSIGQASFSFNGTAVYIFGAKRGNHGHYIVTIDNGEAQRYDGYAPQQTDGTDGVYQVVRFC